MITLFGVDKTATYEEISAIELLRSQGADVQVYLAPNASHGDLHSARLVLSHLHVDVFRYYAGAFAEIDKLLVFGRVEAFDIMRAHGDKPSWVLYSPCNLLPSSFEIGALKDSLIDEVFTKSPLYAIPYTRDLVLKANKGVEHKIGYIPFCNPDSDFTKLRFQERASKSTFIVLQDATDSKEHCFPDHWRTVCKITVPPDKIKKIRALNWGENKTSVAGNIGDSVCKWNGEIEASLLHRPPHWEDIADEYSTSDVALNFYPAEEPFAFNTARAILSGVPVVAGATKAQREILKHGETGFLARTGDEAAYLTSRLAWEPFLRAEIATKAYKWFITGGPGNIDNCLMWWKQIGAL